MKTENGVNKLERGEIAYLGTYAGVEICQGNRKSDNSPYSFSKHRCYVHLQTAEGKSYDKFIEAIFDANYNPQIKLGQACCVVFGIKGDPTKAPSVVAFLPVKEPATPTPAPVAPIHVAPVSDTHNPDTDDLVPTAEPTPFCE